MAVDAARIHPGLWRADQVGHTSVAAHPSQFPTLDAALPGGGWPLGMLTELIARNPGVGELRLLIPLLRQLTRERKIVIMLAPPLIPYGPALATYGVDLDYLLIIQAPNAADRLWAVEQTLKSTSFGALLAWLPQDRTRPEHLRRMQLAAQTCRGPVFLFRDLPAQNESSPAPLRLLLLPRPGQMLSVQLLKRRGPVLADPLLLQLPQPPLALRLRPHHPQHPQHPQRPEIAPARPMPTPSLHAIHGGSQAQGDADTATESTTERAASPTTRVHSGDARHDNSGAPGNPALPRPAAAHVATAYAAAARSPRSGGSRLH